MDKLNLKKEKVKTHNIRKILPLYKKHKGLLSITIIILCCSGFFGIIQPIFAANALSNLAQANYDNAIKFAVLMCATGLMRVLFNGLDEYFYMNIITISSQRYRVLTRVDILKGDEYI